MRVGPLSKGIRPLEVDKFMAAEFVWSRSELGTEKQNGEDEAKKKRMSHKKVEMCLLSRMNASQLPGSASCTSGYLIPLRV